MADQATSKFDAAAEKAYAEAAEKSTLASKPAASDTVSATPAAPVKTAPTPKTSDVAIEPAAKAAPAKPPLADKVLAKPAAKKPAAKKTAVKKVAETAPATKKVVAKKVAAKKTVAKAKPRKTAEPAIKTKSIPTAKPITIDTFSKETTMSKAKETAADYAAKLKEGIAELQTRAKTAYEKSTEIASEVGEFSKHNVEAVVESGKILATGMQDLAKSYVEEGKAAVSTITADAKEVAAIKSPAEFAQLQSKIASRNFDATVATLSKTTEAWVKLANEAFAPISGRVSVAMDKVRTAA